jgi:serine carboxypeptidase-like clade 2
MFEILHVENKKFQTCNEEVAAKYVKAADQSYPLYKELIKQKLRIWVASGDHDADVPITGTLNWI